MNCVSVLNIMHSTFITVYLLIDRDENISREGTKGYVMRFKYPVRC